MKYFLILLITVLFISCDLETNSLTESKAITYDIGSKKDTLNSKEKKLNEQVEALLICPKYVFKSFKQRGDSIKLFMEQALDSSLKNTKDWEEKFFCAFPNSFKEMDSLFGNPSNGALYHSSKFDKNHSLFGSMNPIINFFGNLNSIPEKQYYEKFINICIDGNYQADNIQTAFGFGDRLLKYPKSTCQALEKRSNEDIKSVFRFIFDNVHPSRERTETYYNNLLLMIENKRLASLLTESYEKLMNQNHEH